MLRIRLPGATSRFLPGGCGLLPAAGPRLLLRPAPARPALFLRYLPNAFLVKGFPVNQINTDRMRNAQERLDAALVRLAIVCRQRVEHWHEPEIRQEYQHFGYLARVLSGDGPIRHALANHGLNIAVRRIHGINELLRDEARVLNGIR